MAQNQREQKPLHLAKLHVHKGDTVLILAGKDRGKTGKVLRTMPRENKVIVEGLNIAKRHMRAGRGVLQSGVIEKPMPLHSLERHGAVHRMRQADSDRARARSDGH